ncbi:hypothetical protein [Roseovarius autotrophicus]|nr:hypothetical protein [Roseovarius autotrophicus]
MRQIKDGYRGASVLLGLNADLLLFLAALAVALIAASYLSGF